MILVNLLAGVMLTPAQLVNTPRPDPRQRQYEIANFEKTSAKAFEQGARFAAAADYLRMALVLGLGMLIGRMGAVSHRELAELKATLTRLGSRSSTKELEIRET